MPEDYITTAQAAEILGVAQTTVARLIYRKVLKAEKFGPVWQVERGSVEAYRQANEGKAKHDPTRTKRDEN